LHVKAKIDAPLWFLNDRTDVRSAFYCEEIATEFDVQGLELDWVGVCWDADFRYCSGQWVSHRFRGTRWEHVNTLEGRLYLKNAYRVILTRARQGMIIFVPRGADNDPTRSPAYYDQTFDFLAPLPKVFRGEGVESKGASDTQGILLGLPSSRKEARGRCAWRRLSEGRLD
jgi:hypothetical protein